MGLRLFLLGSALVICHTLKVGLPARHGIRAPAPVAKANLQQLTKKQLVAKLKKVGLKTSGKKVELISRLEAFTASPPDVSEAVESLRARTADVAPKEWSAVGGSAGAHRMAGRWPPPPAVEPAEVPVVGPLFEGVRWGSSLLPDGASPWSDAATVVVKSEEGATFKAGFETPWFAEPDVSPDEGLPVASTEKAAHYGVF